MITLTTKRVSSTTEKKECLISIDFVSSPGGLVDGNDDNDLRAQAPSNTNAPLCPSQPPALHFSSNGEPTSPLLRLKKKRTQTEAPESPVARISSGDDDGTNIDQDVPGLPAGDTAPSGSQNVIVDEHMADVDNDEGGGDEDELACYLLLAPVSY